MEIEEKYIIIAINIDLYQLPLSTHDMYREGIIYNISKTKPINISRNPCH